MTSINLYSNSPLSTTSSSQTSHCGDSERAGEHISRNSSVSPGTTSPPLASTPPIEKHYPHSQIPTLSQVQTPTMSFSRSVPRISTRSSVSEAPLPWNIDETSSPYTPTSHSRKSSFAPPPPRASQRDSADTSFTLSLTHSSSLPVVPLHVSPFILASPYSPSSTHSHMFDLSHPPGYTQDARASFSDRSACVPTYDNSTPFYQNNYSVSSPMTPIVRGRGILDNDPSLYLQDEADVEEESVWGTATRWAKAAGKRMSQGEQQLWRIVSSVTNGDDDH